MSGTRVPCMAAVWFKQAQCAVPDVLLSVLFSAVWHQQSTSAGSLRLSALCPCRPAPGGGMHGVRLPMGVLRVSLGHMSRSGSKGRKTCVLQISSRKAPPLAATPGSPWEPSWLSGLPLIRWGLPKFSLPAQV